MNDANFIIEISRIFEGCNDIEFHPDAIPVMRKLIIGTGYESAFF